MGGRVPRDDPADPMPAWLWEELIELAGAFGHLSEEARYGAAMRNLAARPRAHFDALAEGCVRETAGGEREGPF